MTGGLNVMTVTFFASERLHARSAVNTIQAQRSVVEEHAECSVMEVCTRYGHLGEMRQFVYFFFFALCPKL